MKLNISYVIHDDSQPAISEYIPLLKIWLNSSQEDELINENSFGNGSGIASGSGELHVVMDRVNGTSTTRIEMNGEGDSEDCRGDKDCNGTGKGVICNASQIIKKLNRGKIC